MRGLMIGCALVLGGVFVARSFAAGSGDAAGVGSRITTLYHLDPARCAISLVTGDDGHVITDGYIRNRESDVDFGNYAKDAFTIGIEGSRKGVLIDLGSTEDLAKRFDFVEPTAGRNGYTSIHFAGGALLITRDVERTFQSLPESKHLLGTTAPLASLPVVVGHIYLMRLVDGRDPSFERIAKLLVLSHVPGESVTFRWDLLTR